jgi:hypothetical protein
VTVDAVITLLALIKYAGDEEKAATIAHDFRHEHYMDPEIAKVAANLVARKAEQLRRGPVTRSVIRGTEGARIEAVRRRAVQAHEMLSTGADLGTVVKTFDEQRQSDVEKGTTAYFQRQMGQEIHVKFTKINSGARRPDDITKRHLSFDIDADVEVTVGDQTLHFEGLVHEVIPRAIKEQDDDVLPFISFAAVPLCEILMGSNIILNITVPAAVAVAMGKLSPSEAAEAAEVGGYISAGVPGARERAEKVGLLAARMVNQLSE